MTSINNFDAVTKRQEERNICWGKVVPEASAAVDRGWARDELYAKRLARGANCVWALSDVSVFYLDFHSFVTIFSCTVAKREKLKQRFLSCPSDFKWDELVTFLEGYGYRLKPGGKTGGSRRKFTNESGIIISLHEPHPQKVLKQYQIREITRHLKQEGHL